MTPLQAAREHLGLSQGELAKISGVNQASICRFEKRDRRCTLVAASKLVPQLNNLVTEMHLLYPDRFKSFAKSLSRRSRKAA